MALARQVGGPVLAVIAVGLGLLAIPVAGILLGPIAFFLAGAARERTPPGPFRALAAAGRVLSVVATAVWLLILVGYGTALLQLWRS
ncbi:MAG: hypothetical protein ACREPA_03440 [Candidatus Dormibacteraceae bacterium]